MKAVMVLIMAMAVPAMALPLGGPLYGTAEKFDDYALGTADANYNANWTLFGPGSRPAVVSETGKFSSGTQSIKLLSRHELSYDLVPDIQAIDGSKNALNGTDENPLQSQFHLRPKASGFNHHNSFFVELCKG